MRKLLLLHCSAYRPYCIYIRPLCYLAWSNIINAYPVACVPRWRYRLERALIPAPASLSRPGSMWGGAAHSRFTLVA